jgi:hypothetical protein
MAVVLDLLSSCNGHSQSQRKRQKHFAGNTATGTDSYSMQHFNVSLLSVRHVCEERNTSSKRHINATLFRERRPNCNHSTGYVFRSPTLPIELHTPALEWLHRALRQT